MTGGPDSFGAGGWIGSPLEDALPGLSAGGAPRPASPAEQLLGAPLPQMRERVRSLALLAEVRGAAGDEERRDEALGLAQRAQAHVCERVRADGPRAVAEEGARLADLLCEAAAADDRSRRPAQARAALERALRAAPGHARALLALAALDLKEGRLEQAAAHCETLLRVEGVGGSPAVVYELCGGARQPCALVRAVGASLLVCPILVCRYASSSSGTKQGCPHRRAAPRAT